MQLTVIPEQRSKKINRLPQPKLLTYDDYARLTPPDSGNYELHNGKIIFIASPVAAHQIASSNLHTELGYFIKQQKLGRLFSAPMDVRFSPNNVVQPDLFFIPNDRLSIVQRIIEGTPDLVIEIKSDGNSASEMIYKKYLYEMGSVKEYWVVLPNTKTVRQYALIDEELHHVCTLSVTDILKSSVLPNFEMPVAAIFE